MDPNLINALSNIASPLLSGLLAWFVARHTANKELERLERTWNRESMVSSEEEFSLMVSAVSRCTMDVTLPTRKAALERVAAIRSKESGNLASALDNLYSSLQTMDYKRIDVSLTEVIDQKRTVLGQQNRGNSTCKKP